VDVRSAAEGLAASGLKPDPRSQRRAARRAASQTEILDAAERVFGERGPRDGSLRQIAHLSGFSTAAIYLFFENKEHLLTETLLRRGVGLNDTIRTVAESDLSPLMKLHRIVDVTVAFFEAHPHFRQLLRRIASGSTIVGPALAEHASDVDGRFTEAMTLLAGVVEEGQAAGEIRGGDASAMARLYAVLVNEHVFLSAEAASESGLTAEQFHGLIDGALRSPPRSTSRSQRQGGPS
jgi:AcrR family transcriptional regulator